MYSAIRELLLTLKEALNGWHIRQNLTIQYLGTAGRTNIQELARSITVSRVLKDNT